MLTRLVRFDAGEVVMRSLMVLSALAGSLLLAACTPKADHAQQTSAPTTNEPQHSAAHDATKPSTEVPKEIAVKKVEKTESEWKAILTPEQYRVLREKGTERAYTGKYEKTKTKGIYKCAACKAVLFSSDAKFDSGCGWPSFFTPLAKGTVVETTDMSHGMIRTEITCAACGGHLGHVFNDSPDQPTGLRYCINSVSLELEPAEGEAKK